MLIFNDDGARPINFTVVMTVYQRPDLALRAVSTVVSQIYDAWELLIYADGPHPGLQQALEEYALHMGKVDRIRYTEHQCPQGTYGNPLRRMGLEAANGDYVVFMGHDCLLNMDYLLRHTHNVTIPERKTALSVLRVDHWVKRKMETPSTELELERHFGVLPGPHVTAASLQPGTIDLTCAAFPRDIAREVGVFQPAWDTEYAADFLSIAACLARVPMVYSQIVAAAHF